MYRSKRTLNTLIVIVSLTLILSSFSISFAQGEYNQAPSLDELVQEGDLPPVENRLPDNPKVVEPVDEIGKYGGEIRRVYTGVPDFWNSIKVGAYMEPLLQMTQESRGEPNLVESWEYLENDKDIRVHIREGVKWSDGHLFTVDDIIYDLKTRESDEIAAVAPNNMSSKVKVDEIKKIDDYTVVIPFKEKYPFNFLAGPGQASLPTASPKHYLKQFDPRYNNDKSTQDLVEAWSPGRFGEGLENKPTLAAWDIIEYTPKVRIVAERNPYFYKVDPEGNQLPYIDKIVFDYTASIDNIPRMVKAGEIDFQVRHINFGDFTYYKQNESAGGYVTKVITQSSLAPAVYLVYSTQDKLLRELYYKKDFRVALSHGMDRQAINESFYYGQAEPWADSPLRESTFFPGEKYAKMYTEYDPEKSRRLLNELGVTDTDGDGYREYKGETVSITIDMDEAGAGGPVALAEMVASQWEEIGIKTVANPIDRSLIDVRQAENKTEAVVWKVDAANNPLFFSLHWTHLDPPSTAGTGHAGHGLNRWVHTDGEEGVEPPEFIKEINKLFKEASTTLDPEKRAEIGKEMAQIHSSQVYLLATTTFKDVGIANENLSNIPETWIGGHAMIQSRTVRPWQFFYTD